MLETKPKRRASYLAHLLTHWRDAIISIDSTGTVLTWNKAAESMFGYSEQESIGASIYAMIVPDDSREALIKQISNVSSTGEGIERIKTEFTSRAHGRIPVSVSITKVGDEQGHLLDVMVLTVTDIREAKRIEESLLRVERLKVVGELAEGVAHDFNNLLAGILGRVELLMRQWKQKGVPQESIRSLEVIESLALRGAETVRKLQEFAHCQADGSVQTSFDLSKLLEDVVQVARPVWKDKAEEKGVVYTIEKHLQAALPFRGDLDALRGTFYSLLINAIEASEKGGPVRIETEDQGKELVVRISDQGKGIDPSEREKVFDSFYTSKISQGLGLGLSTAYSTVVRHGGSIEIRENPGGGTIVEVRLPCAREVVDYRISEKAGKNILVIEDEESIRDLLEDVLSASGYRVWKASSGIEGIEIFKQNDIHLVLTDAGMPAMTGWEVARHCKQIKENVPIILMTGWDYHPYSQDASRSSVDLILTKPFRIDDVVGAITSCLCNVRENC